MATQQKQWTRNDQSAYQAFISVLNQFGFKGNAEISAAVKKMVLTGVTDFNVIQLGLEGTDAWKTRFKGNEIRRQNGMNVLSVSEYLATENSYANILHSAGLPHGFYNDPADFAKFIGNDMAPTELQTRVSIATDLKNREDPAITDALKHRGMSDGDILSMFLNPSRALPLLQKKYQSVLISAAADRAGLNSKVDYANKLAGQGVTEQQAEQGYGVVADITPALEKLGDIYGQKYSQRDAEREVFENNADALHLRQKLTSEEKAAFAGSSGVGQQSLTKSGTGSY